MRCRRSTTRWSVANMPPWPLCRPGWARREKLAVMATPLAMMSCCFGLLAFTPVPKISSRSNNIPSINKIRLAAPPDDLSALTSDEDLALLLGKIQKRVSTFEEEERARLETEAATKGALEKAAPVLLPTTLVATVAAFRATLQANKAVRELEQAKLEKATPPSFREVLLSATYVAVGAGVGIAFGGTPLEAAQLALKPPPAVVKRDLRPTAAEPPAPLSAPPVFTTAPTPAPATATTGGFPADLLAYVESAPPMVQGAGAAAFAAAAGIAAGTTAATKEPTKEQKQQGGGVVKMAEADTAARSTLQTLASSTPVVAVKGEKLLVSSEVIDAATAALDASFVAQEEEEEMGVAAVVAEDGEEEEGDGEEYGAELEDVPDAAEIDKLFERFGERGSLEEIEGDGEGIDEEAVGDMAVMEMEAEEEDALEEVVSNAAVALMEEEEEEAFVSDSAVVAMEEEEAEAFAGAIADDDADYDEALAAEIERLDEEERAAKEMEAREELAWLVRQDLEREAAAAAAAAAEDEDEG